MSSAEDITNERGHSLLLGPGGHRVRPGDNSVYGTNASLYECVLQACQQSSVMMEVLHPGPNPSTSRGHRLMTGGPVPQALHLCCTCLP